MPAARSATTVTVRSLVEDACRRFKRNRLAFGHGTTNAWDEAAYLVLHALGQPPEELVPHLARSVSARKRERVLRLIERRIRHRIPAAYLTHEAWLGDLRFYVDERVIVPRSFIAEWLREGLAPWVMRPQSIRRALDLGTGSGCLAIVLAKTFPVAQIDAVDISDGALAVAKRNVAAYRLRRRVHLRKSDLFGELRGKRYDLIVANPPYVSAAAMRRLPTEHRHEPGLALAGGADGFDFVRAILRDAAAHLTEKGLLVVEVGHNRSRLESAFPRLPFVWPHTSGGDDCVFILERRDLSVAPAPRASARAARRRARRGVAAFPRRLTRRSARA